MPRDQNISSESREYYGNPFPINYTQLHGQVLEPKKSGTHYFRGTVELKGETKIALESIWRRDPNNERPDTVAICSIDPLAIKTISRDNKRRLLRALADQKDSVTVEVNKPSKNGKKDHYKKVFDSSSDGQLSLATIFALSVAMRSHDMEIFAELVGLATLETVLELSQFLRPPLITIGHLKKLIHCASRSITRGRSPNPVPLSWNITEAIAAVLRKCKVGESNSSLQDLVRETFLHANNDQDRGCQVGLLVAGIQKYVRFGKEKIEERLKQAEAITDVVTGLLGAVPGGGFAFAPVGSILKYVLHKKAQEAVAKDASEAVKKYFCQAIRGPIFLDGKISLKRENGKMESVVVDKIVFIEWYEEMLEWAGV